MKNFTKVLSLVMVLVIALMSFTGCASNYSKQEIIDNPQNPRLQQFLNFVNRK